MNYKVEQEIYFGEPHDVVTVVALGVKYKYLVLGDGLLPVSLNRTINDREVVAFAKKRYFGDVVMKHRYNELSKSAKR